MDIRKLSGDGVEYIERDPWRFIGFSRHDALCRLQLLKKDDIALVMFTELAGNPGTSITNATEALATSVVHAFGLSPRKCLFIEHYPADRATGRDEDYSIVTYEWVGQTEPAAVKASWEHLEKPDAAALLMRMLEKANAKN